MILLDTHVALWWHVGARRLSATAAREISRASRILVSPISCWEVVLLERRGKITLDRPLFEWIAGLYAEDRVEPAPLTPQAAAAAALLPVNFPGDPADRFIYSTARELAVPLVTKDGQIRDYARESREIRTVW